MSTFPYLTIPRGIRRLVLSVMFAGFFLFSVFRVAAQVTILHSFGDGTVPNDGAAPSAALIQASDGNFYGSTSGTAINPFGSGVIFQLTPSGVVSTVYTFARLNLRPPDLLLFQHDLVGTTSIGGRTNSYGSSGYGTIFRVTSSGKEVFLHEFNQDLSYPIRSLVLGPHGELYGTTTQGGSQSGGVFKFNPVTTNLTVLYRFPSPSSPASPLVLGQDGNFYGLASTGTSSAIFMMTPAGEVTILYTFPLFTVGVGPLVQDAGGNFYGATDLNGAHSAGTVFKMNPQHQVSLLHSFGQKPDGTDPGTTVVIGPDGNLYGTTPSGGTAGAGIVYRLVPDGSSYRVLHNFYDGSVTNDGYGPGGPLIVGADNNLYGTTTAGGSVGLGVIFKIVP
jgi:uncharacterized repeat protein (TIGR03803 family)